MQTKNDIDALIIKSKIEKLLLEKDYINLLPILFKLKGRPLTLETHFPFSPIFNKNFPDKLILKTGRQCGKTTSIAILVLLKLITHPHFNILVMQPLYETAKRFSNNYIRQLIKDSPFIRQYFSSDKSMVDNVLQKDCMNGSKLFLSYAYLTALRVLGISADNVFFDEVQDIDPAFIPIVSETASASRYANFVYSGTARSFENTIERLWKESSQDEFVIPCRSCTTNGFTTWNICSTEQHLLDIIGPYRDDISEERPGTICRKCKNPIHPREGIWVSRFPEKRKIFRGLHIPQVILPVHYADPKKWKILKEKQEGKSFYTESKFFNEVLGESYDSASGLLTYSDILQSIKLEIKTKEDAINYRKRLDKLVIMGIDWGGGGENETSKTSISIVGRKPGSDVLEVFYYEILPTSMSFFAEAEYILDLYKKFEVTYIAHDFSGRGETCEEMMINNGILRRNILPFLYTGHTKKIISYKPVTHNSRDFRIINKIRSIMILCTAIKLGKVIINKDPKTDSINELGTPGQFLNLVLEEKASSIFDCYLILKRENTSDDFVQSTNLACSSYWYITKKWPVIVSQDEFEN